MTPHELEALATLLYGRQWVRPLADLLGVKVRTVQFWMATPPAAIKPIPPGVPGEILQAIRGAGVLEHKRMLGEARRMGEALEAVRRALDA